MPATLDSFAPDGVDAVLATASGDALDSVLESVREGGRVAWPHGVQPEPEVPEGVKGTAYNGDPDRDTLDELNRLIGDGPFQVHVAETFDLDEAAEAHRRLDDHYLGKLALSVEG